MASITPVGIEKAYRAMAQTIMCSAEHIESGVGEAAAQRVPARGTGADIEGKLGVGEVGTFGGEGVVVFIAPVKGDAGFWQHRDKLGLMQDDITPEEHGLVVS